jgi:hypothetical protein
MPYAQGFYGKRDHTHDMRGSNRIDIVFSFENLVVSAQWRTYLELFEEEMSRLRNAKMRIVLP